MEPKNKPQENKRMENPPGKTFTVMSGKGGVGKSTVAVNLAASLSALGHKTGLMDVDLHGPSIPTMLGIADQSLHGQDGKILPFEIGENLKVVSIGLMMENTNDAIIWRGPLMHSAIREFINDVHWGDLDYLIVDSPPGTGDVHLSLSQFLPENNSAVIVTTPQNVSICDVKKSVSFCNSVNIPISGIIENMSGFKCPHCNETVEIFDTGGGEKMANEMNLKFLGKIPIDPMVSKCGDLGNPIILNEENSSTKNELENIISVLTKKEN